MPRCCAASMTSAQHACTWSCHGLEDTQVQNLGPPLAEPASVFELLTLRCKPYARGLAGRCHFICAGAKLNSYGHMALRRLLSREHFPDSFAQAPMIAQFSSLGSLNEDWLREFRHSMACGLKASGWYSRSCLSEARSCQAAGCAAHRQSLQSPARTCLTGQKLGDATPGPRGLQLVWPTAEEVRLSLEGWSAGDSIPGPAKNVDRPFLQQYWHR